MIVLDSSACIDFLNGNEDLKVEIDKSNDLLCVTSVSVYEILIGLEYMKRKKPKRYKELNQIWLNFIENITILELDFNSARYSAKIYDILQMNGKMIDDNDILIAGIMFANGIKMIITKNTNYFSRIEGIDVISY